MAQANVVTVMSELLRDWQAQGAELGGALSTVRRSGNVFSLFGMGADEVSHSAFLAWLLDPAGSHGNGTGFLEAFLRVAQPSIRLRLPPWYEVQTEMSGATSIVDIVAYRPGEFLLFIENKTTSPDTPGQHDREFQDLRRMGAVLGVPEDCQIAVYLTPSGRRALGESRELWHRVAYRDLTRALARLAPEVNNERTRLLLGDWLDASTHFGGVWRSGLSALSSASILVGAHWPTVLEIMSAREQLDQELLALLYGLEPRLAELPWWRDGWEFRRAKTWIYTFNRAWLDDDGHTSMSMGVSPFDADSIFGAGSPPVFYIWIRKQHQDLREALMAALEAEGRPIQKNHRLILRHPLMQCPHDRVAVERYPEQVSEQIVALFTEYADFMRRHGALIQSRRAPDPTQ